MSSVNLTSHSWIGDEQIELRERGREQLTATKSDSMPAKVAPTEPKMQAKRSISVASIVHHDVAAVATSYGAGYNVNETNEGAWIRRNIKMRECNRFTAKPNKEGKISKLPPLRVPSKNATTGTTVPSEANPMCYCGYAKDQHDIDAQFNPKPSDKWKKETHTKSLTTTTFGDIEFVGFGQKIGKYARVDQDTDVKVVLELIIKKWKLDKPNLLISVTGGAKNFNMKPRLKEMFRKGLTKAASSTGAWITTGGMHAGVMKHVGEAVRDYSLASIGSKKIITLGISPWGCVQHKEVLVSEDGYGKWPAPYRIESHVEPLESHLDPNHSHFIMVDNGTQHQFATEIGFRTTMENAISKMKTNTGDDAVAIPIVLLVLEGGPGTLETVHSSIQNKTPTVIVEGSGRAADILAFAYHNSSEEEFESVDREGRKQKSTRVKIDPEIQAQIAEKIETEFHDSRDLATRVGWVIESVQNRDLLSIFQLDSKNSAKDIDMAILKALLKAAKHEVLNQLRLALAWNRIDVAKAEIFTDERQWETGTLDHVMLTAILLDRVAFVKLFLENGVSLREFLTTRILLYLYNNIPKNSLLYTQLEKIKLKKNIHQDSITLYHVGLLIQHLIGDFYNPLYLENAAYSNAKLPAMVAQNRTSDLVSETHLDRDMATPRQKHDFYKPERELFLWAVLMTRQEMSLLFWEEGKEALPSALVANNLLKSISDKTDDSDLVERIQLDALDYEEKAIGVLNECYAVDEKRAKDLLVRELGNWGNATCVLIAVQADNKRFISQTACQALLNNIWMGKMLQENSTWQLVASMFVPILIFSMIEFHPDEKATQKAIEQEMESGDTKKKSVRLKSREMKPLTRQMTVMTIEDPNGDIQFSRHVVEYSWSQKLLHFYSAPVITFYFNVLSYIIFLLIYSYILLVLLKPQMDNFEYILIAWVITIFSEEVRQVLMEGSGSLKSKLYNYITDLWNMVDVLTIGLFICGMVLRALPYSASFEAARIVLGINILSFFFRVLHIFSVHKELGPKLVMIGNMVVDLMYFVVILLVFIVAYGVASQAILFPNTALSPNIILDVLRRPYWQMYGELFLEDIEGTATCTDNATLYEANVLPRCPSETGKYAVPVLLGMYILFTNVLLLNLLIAMFSYTFQKIQNHTEEIWNFQRYNLIYEYYTRPMLPPPLISLSHIYILLRYLYSCCCCSAKPRSTSGFRKVFDNKEEEKQLIHWENKVADAYMTKTQLTLSQTLQNKVDVTTTKMDQVLLKLSDMQEQLGVPGATTAAAIPAMSDMASIPRQEDQRLARLEGHIVSTFEALDWIMKAMVENRMAGQNKPPALPDIRKTRKDEERKKTEESEKVKEYAMGLAEKRVKLHYKSRQSPYIRSMVFREVVPDEKVLWSASYPEYEPVTYTADVVKEKPEWADIMDLLLMSPGSRPVLPFNQYDEKCRIDRTSHTGIYEVKDGIPLNPVGRTGIIGRGRLGRWGPNHAGDPVLTRWKLNADGNKMMVGNKPLLEFVAVMREDSKQWALPGSLTSPGESVDDNIKSDITEEALSYLAEDETLEETKIALKTLLAEGVEVYRGYADDPRNTDNAWIETIGINYHDSEGKIFQHFHLKSLKDFHGGANNVAASWHAVTSTMSLYGAHQHILKKVARRHKAAY